MILSAYRNPPYRSPTPRNQPVPDHNPPPQPASSPNKRKRSHSTSDVPVLPSTPPPTRLAIDTVSRVHNESDSGAASPRTKVAEKFETLRLVRAESPKKKSKTRPDPQTPAHGHPPFLGVVQSPRSTSPSPTPTPPAPRDSEGDGDRAMDPIATSTPSPNADADPLHWRDSEITGHRIDASVDDDGEGINGIGFKPTSAMAFARSQKRKAQVSEWKAREAREARQRRLERRKAGERTGDGDGRGRGNGTGRGVRFVESEGEG